MYLYHFEIFACEMYRDLETRIRRSFKVIGSDIIAYDVLLSNYGYITHRFFTYLISKILRPWSPDQGLLKVIETGRPLSRIFYSISAG